MASGRIDGIDGLRAYAALIVFCVHFVQLAAAIPELDLTSWPFRYLVDSHHGVDLFFLLSGYLIAGLVMSRGFSYGAFLRARVLRLYPALLASLLLYGTYHIVVQGEQIGLGTIIGNVLLLNGITQLGVEPMNSPTWSLCFEFAFYLTFPLLFAAGSGTPVKRLLRTSAIMLLLIAVAASIDDQYARAAMFLVGAWLRVLPRDRWRPSEPVVIALYFAATTALLWISRWVVGIPVFALPAFWLVDTVIAGGVVSRVLSWAPLREFGRISYSFYLMHIAGIAAAARVVVAFGFSGVAGAVMLFALGLALAIVGSVISYMLFERPYFASAATAKRVAATAG